jgi:hypothetical protein
VMTPGGFHVILKEVSPRVKEGEGNPKPFIMKEVSPRGKEGEGNPKPLINADIK